MQNENQPMAPGESCLRIGAGVSGRRPGRILARARPRLVLAAALGAALVASVMMAGLPDRFRTNKAKETLVAILSVANTLDLSLAEHYSLPSTPRGLVSLASVRHSVTVHSPRYFPDRDAWGRELLYWSDGYDYMIVSYGADRQPDYDYDQPVPYDSVRRGTVTRVPQQDIVVVGGEIWQAPVFRRWGLATMAMMRSISTAIESYAVDTNFYPGPTNGTVEVSTLASVLSPVYIRLLPTEDEWSYPLLYWSDLRNYAVISTGADGTAEFPYSTWQASDFLSFPVDQTTEPTRDVVLVNGSFVQWPRGTRR